jgi:hypothetical protein
LIASLRLLDKSIIVSSNIRRPSPFLYRRINFLIFSRNVSRLSLLQQETGLFDRGLLPYRPVLTNRSPPLSLYLSVGNHGINQVYPTHVFVLLSPVMSRLRNMTYLRPIPSQSDDIRA